MTQASIDCRNMWAERIERCLSSSMSIERWCKLNHVGRSSLYAWLARFREEEPGRFPPKERSHLELDRTHQGRSGGFQGHRARRHFLRRHRCFICLYYCRLAEGCFRWEHRPDYADPRLEFDRVRLHLLLYGLDAMAAELPSPVTASNIL